MSEEVKKLITKDDLINDGFMINKKFVVVDSTLYTPEAFEYIQELVNFTGSILFVSDTKKIYARGKYFGGDIFQADLLYFNQFETFNEEGLKTGITAAQHAKSTMEFHGGEHMTLFAEYDNITGANRVHFDYDLNNAVNKDRFTIDQNAQYNLAVVDGKVKMEKYIPINITMSSLPILEYDSGDTDVVIKLSITGSKPLTQMDISVEFDSPELNENIILTDYIDLEKSNTSEVYGHVPNNTDMTFILKYSDGETNKIAKVKQTWGYGCIYGSAILDNQPSVEHFNEFNKYVISNNPAKTVTIEQNGEEYGWFVCPAEFNVVFTDASTNLQGGWRKEYKFEYYCFNTVYQVYRTDHSGLGNIKWIISKK
jgi:hypothetical protein